MFHHEKQLFHPVGVERPNPQYAALLQEQLGGGNGELKAAMQYLSQSFRIRDGRIKDLFLDIAAGSVGIGGSQTGIYPLDSPGGWQLMGMTPVKTYDPSREKPILLEAGDYIRFIPVEEAEYLRIKEAADQNRYQCTVREEEV